MICNFPYQGTLWWLSAANRPKKSIWGVFSSAMAFAGGKTGGVGTLRACCSLAHIFLRLCAMATIPNSQETFGRLRRRNLLNPRFHLIWPNTGSGSIHRFFLKCIPLIDHRLPRAICLCRCRLGLVCTIRSVFAWWHIPRRGHPSQRWAL